MTKKVIDPSVLEQQLGGDNEFLIEVLRDFRKQRDELSAQIREALSAGDLATVSAQAHRLKGSLLTLGAGVAADAAYRVESLARDQDAGIAAAVAEFERELERLDPELDWLSEHGFRSRPIR